MGTEIKAWQIIDNKLIPINATMPEGDRWEHELERWIRDNPEIIGEDIMIIGWQVETDSGPIDLLGVDRSGNTVIIELKRGQLPREAIAQAIDYASNVAEWKDLARLNEVCQKYLSKDLEDAFYEKFTDVEDFDLESITFNSTQRIILVGFAIEVSLERMINWLSNSYNVNINAVILNYAKTKGGEEHELLMMTSIISEEIVQERKGRSYFDISDYSEDELKDKLRETLSRPSKLTPRFIEFLEILLSDDRVFRRDEEIVPMLAKRLGVDEGQTGRYLSGISAFLTKKQNSHLRQLIYFERERAGQLKDNYRIREAKYRDLIRSVIDNLKKNDIDG